MLHTVAFYQSVDQAAAYVAISAVPDQVVRVSGADIQTPSLNNVVAVAAMIETAAAHRARLVAPSLRILSNFQISPLNGGAAGAVEPGSPHALADLRANPLVLETGEQLNAELLADPAAAQIQSCVVWLADSPIVPLAAQKMFTVRATAVSALVAGTWSPTAINFDEDLPVGRYRVVGFWPISTGMIAARIVFPGESGWRPGALGSDLQEDVSSPIFRYGNMGAYGEFEDTSPPTIEALSVSADAAAAQMYYLDLVQVRRGISGA